MQMLPCRVEKVRLDRFFYDLAHDFSRQGDLSDALNCFCDAFLVRSTLNDSSQDWLTFYNVQFSMYMLGKRRFDVQIPEGDMVFQLIRERWVEIKTELGKSRLGLVRNLFEWSRTVEIDFPFELDFSDIPGQCDPIFSILEQVG
ncbi:MAG: hypothetical protein PHH94_09235 [Sphaerochaetaceae bacterium]|nr:hypothetical protein [Sphaerochaetaceae bacterium]